MTEAQWLASEDPWRLLDFLRTHPVGMVDNPYPGKGPSHWPSDRKLRLFACALSARVESANKGGIISESAGASNTMPTLT